MSFDHLTTALRKELARGTLDAVLARHVADVPTLADVPDAQALVTRLDVARPYSEERDALLADLLRLHRASNDGAALGALVYATHAGVLRRGLRLTRARDEPHEGHAEVLLTLIEHLGAYDPDRRSPHVQAGIERDVLRELGRARRAEQRQKAARLAVAGVAHHAANDLLSGTHSLTNLLAPHNPGAPPANDTEPLDVAVVDALLERLVARRLLSARDALLFGRVELLNRRVPDVAGELGMTHAAARKALERARNSLRVRRRLLEIIFVSHRSDEAAF